MKSVTLPSLNPWNWYLSSRKKRIIMVEPVIFLYMLGNFLLITLYFNPQARELESVDSNDTSQLDKRSICINISADEAPTGSNDTDITVASHTTFLIVFGSLAYRPLSIISTLLLGPLSDYFGRRPVMIIALCGAALQAVCVVCVVQFNLNTYITIVAFAIAGITGGSSSIMMSSYSYISDTSTHKWRTVRIGIVDSFVFLAGVVSTGLGKWLLLHLHCRLPELLLLVIACQVAAILYLLIFVPPSISRERRKIMTRNMMTGGLHIVVQGLKILFGLVKKHRAVTCVIWVTLIPIILAAFNLNVSASVQLLFLRDLDLGPELMRAQIALSLASRFLVLVVVLPILVALNMPDPLISLLGAVFTVTMNLFMGLSHKTYQVFIVAILQGMDSLFFPPLRGLPSKLVAAEYQGALFSLLSSAEVLGTFIGEVAFPLISLERYLSPGMTYIAMACLGLVPLPFLITLLGVWCKRRFKTATSSGKTRKKDGETSHTSSGGDSDSNENSTLLSDTSSLIKSKEQ